ncbi:MAG: cell division protein FtsI [Bacilli bacterium]|nr:cell division protein FtsI [Bacilli bacterium]
MKHSAITEDQEKQEWQKRRHFSIRINMFFFFTFLMFSILIIQLARLQFVEGKSYVAAENKLRSGDVTISPIRGNIYDLKGAPIAYTISAQSLFYRLQVEKKKPKEVVAERIQLAKQLEMIFAKYGAKDASPLSANDIITLMDVGIDIDGNPTKAASKIGITYMPRRIKTKLTKEEIAYISEHRDVLKGLEISEESTRVYDSDNIAVQLIGYMRPFDTANTNLNFYKNKNDDYLSKEYVGYDGLELLYQDDLRGKQGSKKYPINASDQIIGSVKITAPEKGHNLVLTIDKDVQLAAQKAVADHVTFLEHSTNPSDFNSLGNKAVAGYAVAMEVDTGRVVAMVNYPDYNPNLWIGGMSTKDFKENSYRYTNGTIRERYADFVDPNEYKKHPSSLVPPGSTLKPLTVLLGLNEGIITPTSRYNDLGVFEYGKDNSKVRNSDSVQNGWITPAQGLQFSSNVFMAAMIGNPLYFMKSDKPALDIWDSYMKSFGLGQLTGSNLPFEFEGERGYIDNKSKTTQTALVQGSFGQSARYTTLQLAQYASMLANHGKRYRPLFVDSIKTYDGQLIQKVQPELLNEQKFPDAYWKVLADGMSKVGISGFDNFPYNVNRKTGTSESVFAGVTVDNAVFIAYAPAEKPKLAIAVVVPEGGFGRYGAGPIARQIFDAYDKYIGLDGKPKG